MALALKMSIVALAALSVLGAASCGGAPAPVRLLVEVTLAPRANQNSPIPVALVAVRDAKFMERVSALSAKQWFEQREQLHRDDPSGRLFTEWEWEYVPGYAPPQAVVEVDGDALGAFVFANYRTPASHRTRLGPQRRFRIELGDEEMVLRPIDATESH
jgi:type VI secretion system protein